MPIIGSRKTWKVSNQANRAQRGPLIRVTHPNGMVTKMYQQDAIDAGLIPGRKAAPPPENKLASLPENKASLPEETPPDDFTTIPGVGQASARSLVAQGIRTFAQLRKADLETVTLSKTVINAIEAWRG